MADEEKELHCPHCQKVIHYGQVVTLPERQTLHMKLESSTGAFSARTIGGMITEFDKLMKSIAKDIGGKVHVFIDSIEKTDKELSLGFVIASVPSKTNNETRS